MFTGIIEGLGVIRSVGTTSGRGRRFVIASDFSLAGTKVGDSVAVSGVCLTVTAIKEQIFTADVSPETLSRSTFGQARIGDRVNLERALRLSDRLDGHLVSGHIDGVGTIQSRTAVGNAILITINAPPGVAWYFIEKGSVAVDGISLTINRCGVDFFGVSIIPHTASLTTVGLKNIGDTVNLEADMIGKYVEKFLIQKKEGDASKNSGVGLELLARAGYL